MDPRAAILIQFSVGADDIAEHDDWHTHEHMPERVALPGFMRGTRWTGVRNSADYCVLYELDSLGALDSDAYRQRLNNPTPWTSNMVKVCSAMRRTLCTVEGSSAPCIGGYAAALTFATALARDSDAGRWLLQDVLPNLHARRGLASWHMLRTTQVAAGPWSGEAVVQSAVVVTAYDVDALTALCESDLGPERLAAHGVDAAQYATGLYKLGVAFSRDPVTGDVAV